MWKKDKRKAQGRGTTPESSDGPASRARAPEPTRGSPESATIGGFITIRGKVTGEQDLLIKGRVEGTVDLGDHVLTIGPDGQVKADIAGRVVMVEGLVEGNIRAAEQVILRSSARAHGDIAAPSVIVEDGAQFRGGVDMGGESEPDDDAGDSTSARSEGTSKPELAAAESRQTDRKDSVTPSAPVS